MSAKIESFEIVDHGIENSQYFQGCGTAFTSFSHVATGIGSNFAEAIDDCLEMIANGGESVDLEGIEKRILKDIGRRTMPKRPAVGQRHGEDCYYHVSIRYNLSTIADEEPHAKPGQFCPTCGVSHCTNRTGHEWNEEAFCIHCGADGNA